ncbi:MAG: hypothetical protein HZA93_03625 [Verrucomicrobia bacterium]|nr:hypothetical protein [Verrucomicrobiota bacterium]
MKNLRRLLASLALLAAASAFAQDSGSSAPARRGPHGPPPEINSDGSITLPDGTVLTPPTVNSDGSITLPDGTVLPPPPVRVPPMKNSDGSITLPDGTVVTPNADGTYTLPNGETVDPSKRGPRGTKPTGQSGG